MSRQSGTDIIADQFPTRATAEVEPGLVGRSVGIGHIDELLGDPEQAITQIQPRIH